MLATQPRCLFSQPPYTLSMMRRLFCVSARPTHIFTPLPVSKMCSERTRSLTRSFSKLSAPIRLMSPVLELHERHLPLSSVQRKFFSNSKPQNPYEVLNIPKTATDKEIKSAYFRQAKLHHPDLNPGDAKAAQRFRECADAYQLLSDPARRAQYDSSGVRDDHYQSAEQQNYDPRDTFKSVYEDVNIMQASSRAALLQSLWLGGGEKQVDGTQEQVGMDSVNLQCMFVFI